MPAQASALTGFPAAVPLPATNTAHRAPALSCELPASGERVSAIGGGGLLGAQRLLPPSQAGLASAVAPGTDASGDTRTGHGGDGSGGEPPTNPMPGPAPSGAASGSAPSGSGLALSGSLSLAGLLLLAAPRAMRRLRLSCEPQLTACFVLIPERPG